MLKLKCLGVNAAFSLRSDIQLGPRLMVGSISATAVYVESLPTPPQLVVARPPRSLHQDGGGGGDAQRRVLALASRVERIGAVNRQRLQALAPKRRRLRGRRKKRSSKSSSRGAVNGGRAGDSGSSSAATSAAGQHQQHQQHPQPQPLPARNQQSSPPGGVRSLPTLPGGVGDGDGRRRSGDSGSVTRGGDGGSTMTLSMGVIVEVSGGLDDSSPGGTEAGASGGDCGDGRGGTTSGVGGGGGGAPLESAHTPDAESEKVESSGQAATLQTATGADAGTTAATMRAVDNDGQLTRTATSQKPRTAARLLP
ncbi:unnamed protein product, partial [Ectocarpus sp. 12 AP-2014]